MKYELSAYEHYDRLIDENNDPFYDPPLLRQHMDKWDGKVFVDSLCLNGSETVLKIGIGTGRIAKKMLPLCKHLTGIDISPKTINRAKENLKDYNNITLVCNDYLKFDFQTHYDIIYSSLTLMHIEDKHQLFAKTAKELTSKGRLVFSVDKNQNNLLDMGEYCIKTFPDTPQSIRKYVSQTSLKIINEIEIENAWIFICLKDNNDGYEI